MRPEDSFVGQPVRSLQTMLRVLAKDDPHLPTVVPDGIYGPETMQAVSAFQRRCGLPATGITDQATWDQIVHDYDHAEIRQNPAAPVQVTMDAGKVFKAGESSPYLYLLQSMLKVLSQEYANLEEPPYTGCLDPGTSETLAAFQLLAGLPPTGELDKVTWKYLANHFTQAADRISRSC